jgi:serine/threonine-protein kinase RsbW
LAPIEHVFTLTSEAEEVRNTLEEVQNCIDGAPAFAEIGDIAQIILGEVLNNVVEHAYQCEGGHPVELILAFADTGVNVSVTDRGITMPKGSPPNGGMPSLDEDGRDALPEGGFGWAMIHALTTGLTYCRDGDRNLLTFSIPAPAL